MAVRSSGAARLALQKLIGRDRVPYREVLRPRPHDLPEGLATAAPAPEGRPWLWTEPPQVLVGGYGDPATYRLPDAPPAVWQSPHDGLAGPEEIRQGYVRHSVDLTMRGGTTSGVVYPLAVCEIASRFRVRNVGGASAGAIAAAVTAAAELGRSSSLPPEVYAPLAEGAQREGHVRPGFVGMSDTIAWLAQITASDLGGTRDEYRLAQLFRPGPRDRRLYALVIAFMRRQVWAGALALLLAFGKWSKLMLAVLAVAGVATVSWLGARLPSWPAVDRPDGSGSWRDLPSLGWAALDMYLFFASVGALLVLVPTLVNRAPKSSPPDWLTGLMSVSSRHRERSLLSYSFWRPLTAAIVLAVTALFTWLRWWDWVAGALAGAALSIAMGGVVAVSTWRYVANVGARHFGLLAGSAPQARRRPSEILAGAARRTVPRAVIPWLSDCLNELAALPEGEVLRFGHLWQGRDFQPGTATGEIIARAHEPTRRLVNLELITTDLSRQRPYRFPLAAGPADDSAETLYFRMEDLAADGDAVFPAEVIEALRDPDPVTVPLTDPNAGTVTLHRLPDPWNLPVIFAVRLSLALPALFKAVRLYRLVPATAIRDDLGREILDRAGNKLMWPEDGKHRAQELWFSDGGITSNFPVHLFDAALPRWPTFGLNLGSYPYQFPHQDVWLPQDWEATVAPAKDLGRAGTTLLGSIVDTARSWRDTMQTGMPGYRGRVAWVRQRPDEGGTNLFMPREIIASMALRGALAGARLSRRFGHPAQWDRHRWLRLRAALDNLHELRRAARDSAPFYTDILAGREGFLDQAGEAYPYDPFNGEINWFVPADGRFWPEATDLLANVTKGDAGDALTDGSPRPQPDLRQVPPE